MNWQKGITDKGISNLRLCNQLEEVDLLGCNAGDGAIAALTGKRNLRRFKTGRNVTDEGLPLILMYCRDRKTSRISKLIGEPTNTLQGQGAVDGAYLVVKTSAFVEGHLQVAV
jgi:hypothetical protein